jgi:adenosylcobinamide amidohydrolase
MPAIDHRNDSGARLPILVWRFPEPILGVCTAPLGGGLGERRWVVNATVEKTYARTDPEDHLREIAAGLRLDGPGVGMLTAVDVSQRVIRTDGGVIAAATVGLGHPTWAAAPDGDLRELHPGTINIVAWIPAVLSEAALVNTVVSVTEAKSQALWEHGLDATGTGTDAVFVACQLSGTRVEPHGGPRSIWGARLARAVHAAVREGTRAWLAGPAGSRTSPARPPSDSLGETRSYPLCDGTVL